MFSKSSKYDKYGTVRFIPDCCCRFQLQAHKPVTEECFTMTASEICLPDDLGVGMIAFRQTQGQDRVSQSLYRASGKGMGGEPGTVN